jgi:trans-2,3-dihydro-3-hydroxyanthranilate isomerase
MKRLHYHLVDVFTNRLFGGNPLAVFTDGANVPPELMQTLAKELNLSETTFVLPPQDPANHFHVRIFTPGKELPMAGHPTVGTAFVLARERMFDWSGDHAEIRFEEAVGTIPVSLQFSNGAPQTITMTQPLPTFGPQIQDKEAIAQMLSLNVGDLDTELPVEVVSCGVPFLFVPLQSLDVARKIQVRPDMVRRLLDPLGMHEVFVFTGEVQHEGSTVHSRMFAPGSGISEDPATGGASGPLGCYLVRYGLVPIADGGPAKIVSEQGIEMGRPSFIKIEIGQKDGELATVRVGGECVYVGEGFIEID